jgi:general stress protein 26
MDRYDDSLAVLQEKIDDLRFCMFTSVAADGTLASQPMTNQQLDDDGCLWFFTSCDTELAENIVARPEVSVTFSQPDDQLYVALSGHATQVTDRERMRELWNPMVEAWFPRGVDDPDLELIRVSVDSADYWDAPSSKMVRLFKMARSVLTGHAPDLGEHGHLRM